MKKRLLALGLAFALIFNTVDVTTAANAPEVTQMEEEQAAEQNQAPDEISTQEIDPAQQEAGEADAAGGAASESNLVSEGNAEDTGEDTTAASDIVPGEDTTDADGDTASTEEDKNAASGSDAAGTEKKDASEATGSDNAGAAVETDGHVDGDGNQDAAKTENPEEETVDESVIDENAADVMVQNAENGIALQADSVENAVAEVTIDGKTKQYIDIDEAFTAVKNVSGATIKLLQDATIDKVNGEGVEVKGADTTLDLNGKTLKQAQAAKYPGGGITIDVCGDSGKLTIKDSKGGGKIQQINAVPAVIASGSSTLIIESGTIENIAEGEWPDTNRICYLNCAVNVDDNATVTINGGTLKGKRGVVEEVSSSGSLTINGGDISGTDGNALIVYGDSPATLSGGTFSTESNEHSIWVDKNGRTAAELLAKDYHYETSTGAESTYSDNGKGVKGNTTVKIPADKQVSYINANGVEAAQTNFAELSGGDHDIAIAQGGWFAVRTDTAIKGLSISDEVNLILCDGATLTVSDTLTVAEGGKLNIYFQTNGTGKLRAATVSNIDQITAPAGAMKKTTDTNGTTFEKCLSHEWGETTSGSVFIKTCTLCGTVNKENAVAKLTTSGSVETYYTTLSEAFSAAVESENSTVQLLMDVQSTENIEVKSGTFTIDLNGKKWEGTTQGVTAVLGVEGGNVTVTSTNGTGTINGYTDLMRNAIFAMRGTVHVTNGVRMNILGVNDDANLTLDTGVIITRKIWGGREGKLAPFLPGKALQCCDENGNTKGEYVSIYNNEASSSDCMVVIDHESCAGHVDDKGKCTICGKSCDHPAATENDNTCPDCQGKLIATLTLKGSEGSTVQKQLSTIEDGISYMGSNISIPDKDEERVDTFEIKLRENAEVTAANGGRFDFSNKHIGTALIFDLNGGIVNGSIYDKANTSGSITIRNGKVGSGTSAFEFSDLKVTLEDVTANGSTWCYDDISVKSGSYKEFQVFDHAEVKLSGGTYQMLTITVKSGESPQKSYADILETGYIYKDPTTGAYIPASNMNENTAVTVAECTDHNTTGTDSKCTKCGMQVNVAAVISGETTTNYTGIQDAVNALQDGDTLKLLCDIDLGDNAGMTLDKNITFDLNGKTLSNNSEVYYPLEIKSSCTVKNGTIKANSSTFAIDIEEVFGNKFAVNLENITAEAVGSMPAVYVQGDVDVTIKSGTYRGLQVGVDSNVVLEGGTFTKCDGGYSIIRRQGYTDSEINYSLDCMLLLAANHVYVNESDNAVSTYGALTETVIVKDGNLARPSAAKIGDSDYVSLQDAINHVENGETVEITNNADLGIGVIYVANGKNFTLDLGGCTVTTTGDRSLFVADKAGNLTVQNGTITGGRAYIENPEGTTVTFNATINAPINISDFYSGNVKFTGGSYSGGVEIYSNHVEISGGSFEKGSDGYSIKSYNTLSTYLAENCKFWTDDTTVTDLSKVTETDKTVSVRTCEHQWEDGVCKICGENCKHDFSKHNGKCTICNYTCPHPGDQVSESNGKYTCADCNEQMVVKVEKDGNTTYYAKHFENNAYHAEDTLKGVFSEAVDGSTVTLLADDLYASAWVTGKNITLNLNGKKLIENNGIVVDIDDNNVVGKLIVTGSGSSEAPENSSYPCTFRVWNGELLFDDNFSGTFGTIYVHGGTLTSDSTDMTFDALEIQNSGAIVSLKGGNFGKICFTGNWGSVTLGDLLASDNPVRKSGNAFKYTGEGGAFVPYNTVIDSNKAIENVTIVPCPHDNITDGDNGGTCSYCGMNNIAAVLTKPNGGIVTYTIGSGYDIFNGLTNNGGTLKLYSDLTYSYYLGTQSDTTTEMVIDLNGHEITPSSATVGVGVLGGKLTIRDSGSTKGKFASTLNVADMTSLTVDGAAVGNITASSKTAKVLLKEGTTFTAIDASNEKCLIAEFLPAGCYIVNDSNTVVDLVQTYISSESGFTVKQIPGTVTAEQKIGEIRYGSNKIADELLPVVTMNDGSTPQLTYEWYYNTDSGAKKLITITKSEDGIVYNMERGAWNNLSVGDKLDVFCIISAETAGTPWKTLVTGYTLTVTAGDLAEASIDLTGSNNPVYTPDGYGSCYQQTLDFRASHNGMGLTEGTDYQIENGSNHGYNAGNYTLVLKGLGKYAGSTLEYEWTIAPRTLTGIGTLDLTKGYDGKTSLTVDTIPFIYGDNQTISLECTGSEAACEVTGDYDDANAGGGKTVTLTVKLTSSNYIFASDSKEETFTVTNASITKAAAPKLTDISHFQKYTVTTAQTVSLGRAGMLMDAGTLTYTAGQAATNGSVNLSSWNVNESGEVTYTLTGGAIGDTVTMPVTVGSLNYESTVVNVIVTLTDKETPVVTANPVTVTYDGKSVPENKITGTAACNGKTVEGTWSWKDGQDLTNVSASGEKTVIFTPADQVNYTTAETKLQLTIERKEVSITDTVIAGTKEYDGTTTAAITDNGKLNGICAGDDLAITAGKAEYTNKDAGKDKTVSFTGFTLTGADADNYMLSGQPVSTKADITAKEVTLTGKISAVNRTYEPDNTSVTLKGTDLKLGGLVGNETLTVSVQNGTIADADAGEKKAVTYLPTLTDGANGGKAENYLLSKTLPSVTVNIRKAAGSMVAPAGLEKLIYNGSEQTLIMAGSSKTGEVQYRLGENGIYSTALPTAKDAGTYTVYYKVVGDKNHEDVAETSMQVTISKRSGSGSHKKNKTEETGNTAVSLPTTVLTETVSASTNPQTGISDVKLPKTEKTENSAQTDAQEPYVSGDTGKSDEDKINNEPVSDMDGTAADETAGTEEPAEETMTDAEAQEPDTRQMNWLILLTIIALLAGAGAVLVWKSKEKKKEE